MVKLEPTRPARILRPETHILLGKFPATQALWTAMARGSLLETWWVFLLCFLTKSKNNGALSPDDWKRVTQHPLTDRKDHLKNSLKWSAGRSWSLCRVLQQASKWLNHQKPNLKPIWSSKNCLSFTKTNELPSNFGVFLYFVKLAVHNTVSQNVCCFIIVLILYSCTFILRWNITTVTFLILFNVFM